MPRPLTVEPVPAAAASSDPSSHNIVEWWRPRKELERAQRAHAARLGYGAFDIRPRFRSDSESLGDRELGASLSELGDCVVQAARRAKGTTATPLANIGERSGEVVVSASSSGQDWLAGGGALGGTNDASFDHVDQQAEAVAPAVAESEGDATEDFPTLLSEIEKEVEQHFEYYHLGSTEGTAVVDQKRATVKGLPSVFADVLVPIQNFLGRHVIRLRAMRRLVNWQDRILTTWAVFALLALSLILALIPWAWALESLLRVIGLALFGPHMYWVGKRQARQAEAEAEKEREYRNASVAQRKAILQEHRRRLMADKQRQLDATTPSPTMKYLRRAPHVGVVEENRTSARLKYRWLADPHRSRAFPRNLPQRVVEMIYGMELNRSGQL